MLSNIRLTLPLLGAALALAACADVGDAPVAETSASGSVAADSVAVVPEGIAVPVDTAASTLEFTAAKVTRTHQGGFERFAGVVYVDGEQVTGADVTAETASIFTDEARLTEHLKSDDFFNAAINPTVRFLVDSVEPMAPADTATAGGATHRASGTLTMAGRSNRVSFPMTIASSAGTLTADADFIIDRQDWGITYPGQPDDLISDEVRVRLHVVAPTPVAPPAQ